MAINLKKEDIMKIDELPDEIKESVLDKNRLINVAEINWYEDRIDEIKEIGEMIGIEIENVYFSGFSSQGDGACFEGEYQYKRKSVKRIKEYAPNEHELIEIAENLQKLQRRFFYQLYARVKHGGHYYHEMCTSIDVSSNEDFMLWLHNDAEDGIVEFLRDFMHWIYRYLEREYDSLTDDKQVEETLKINEYEFDSEGNEL
jgi:hypothetical protein